MGKIIDWIKNHKLLCVLIIIIFYLVTKDSLLASRSTPYSRSYQATDMMPISSKNSAASLGVGGGEMNYSPMSESPPIASVKDRLVIQDSYLSLQVTKVVDVQKKIINKAEEIGGYMVNSSVSNPNNVASATVIVRVPAKELENVLEYYRSLSLKVVSENLQGQDVTDQYVDLEAQLQTYIKTKTKFEEIFDKAVLIQDILQIQREIINIQASIDSIKGQQDYFVKNAELAKITLYLSTDELALPYAPTEVWRPEVIFKKAVRSVFGTLQLIGSLIIWLAVYAIVWAPILLIILFIRKRKKAPAV